MTLPTPRQFANGLLGARAFQHGDALALHQPLELHLQVSSGCNLDCFMCSEHLRPVGARHGRNLKVLPEEVFARLEAEVFPYSERVYFGVGGEPMLAPELPGWIERARRHNQVVHLTTNGTRISTDAIAEVLARDVASIEISIDGATAETYERIRFGARFDVLQRNFERLDRARRALPPAERARVRLCFVILRSNVHELAPLVELAARHGIESVAAWHVIPVTPEGEAESIADEPALWVPHVERARARARELGVEIDLPFEARSVRAGADAAPGSADAAPRSAATAELRARDAQAQLAASSAPPPPHAPPSSGTRSSERAANPLVVLQPPVGPRVHCHMPTLALYVFYDGRVYPCGHPHVHLGSPLGDLTRQSFAEVWNGRAYRNLRAGLARGEAPPVCRDCAVVRGCAPGRRDTPEAVAGSDLGAWYGERDLAPFPIPPSGARTELAAASEVGDPRAAAQLAAWKARALAAERERALLAERAGAIAGHLAEHALHARALEAQVGRPLRHTRIFLRRLLGRDAPPSPVRPTGS